MHKLHYRVGIFVLALLVLGMNALGQTQAASQINPQGPIAAPGSASLAGNSADDSWTHTAGPINVMIELTDLAGVQVYAAMQNGQAKGNVAAATQAQKARIEQAQQSLLRVLAASPFQLQVIYRVQDAYNGIAVVADQSQLAALRALPGVKALHHLIAKERSNASSVPLIGAPTAWQNYGLLGDNIKVGIIDTGIDYMHANFGGPGTAAAFNAIVRTGLSNSAPYFPGAKVVGGTDFAGDAYTGSNTPAPDPNPLDCSAALGGGHGSHVAGTAAGFGENADGSTYTGTYSLSTPFNAMRIGPGVAPHAQLYALRVFGCTGSTNLVTEAINWAIDPNNDGDYSDHLNVINMSLGSSYGGNDDPDVVASNNAALAGVSVVISAGNSGDTYYVSGSPGTAARALSVASSVDSTDVVDGYQVITPTVISGTYGSSNSVAFNWYTGTGQLKPDVTAPAVYVAADPGGCAPFPAGSVTNQIVLVDWVPAGYTTFPCGSVARGNNAVAGGAVGIIMANNLTYLDTAITGVAQIPATFTTGTNGGLIKAHLGDPGGVVVTMSGRFINSGKIVSPDRVDTLSTFTSRGPRGSDSGAKPDIAAPGQGIFSTAAGTGNVGESLSGTSWPPRT